MHFLISPPLLVLSMLVVALVIFRFINKRPPLWVYITRCLLGIVFLFSGLAKLIPGFPNTIGPPQLESELEPYGLALFARFVAVSEGAVGLLLLTRRFATVGALALFPMLAAILVVTISLEWRGTPYVNSFFLGLNALLLYHDRPRLMPLVGLPSTPAVQSLPFKRFHLVWVVLFLVLWAFLGTWPFEPFNVAAMIVVPAVCGGLIVSDWRYEHP